MKLRFHAIVIVAVFTAFTSTCVAQPSQSQAVPTRRSITEKDLFSFVWVADPQVSPDGTHTLFTRVVTDEKRTGYETSIWMVATSGNEAPVRLTNGKHDAHPRWSPDGTRIAFLRGGDKDDQGKPRLPQIATLPLSGGEARTITDLPKGASSPVWSPDGERIAFLSSTDAEDIEKALRKKNDANAKESATAADSDHESDIYVITRAVYRSNDEGYLDFKHHQHVWVIQVPATSEETSKPSQLTTGNYNERGILWTHDGSRIYFLTDRVDEPYYETPTTDIYSVTAIGGTPEKLTTVPMGISDLTLSPDGQRFAFHGSVTHPIRSYSQPDLWVMDVSPNAQPRNLTATYDYDMGDAVFGDNEPPRGGSGPTLFWSPDGRSIFDIVARQGLTPLVRVDAQSGAVTEVTHGDQAVLDFSVPPMHRRQLP